MWLLLKLYGNSLFSVGLKMIINGEASAGGSFLISRDNENFTSLGG
jgi:hypothetical protein